MSKDQYEKVDKQVPAQTQNQQPGIESEMTPAPIYDDENYKGSGKLKGKNVLITGGDSGIGRAVAVAYAKEGANVAIAYLAEQEDADADKTVELIEKYGVKSYKIRIDISEEEHCEQLVDKVIDEFGSLDILVNNAGKQFPQKEIAAISEDQLRDTFETNFFGLFYLSKAALKHMKKGDAIINTSSVTAYNGSANLLDYSATKGAITSFTRSLALNVAEKGIRVNAVAPGPIWTPLIPATFDGQKVKQHGADTPMKRRGQPAENAPAYVFLASSDATYITGQTIHVDGGGFVGS
ncbi:SDR family oxidoreductase [Sporosarcina pasteurii]|uniref:General stress protein 39 n=1 Tax=Sporosarcina pasteurii TaxID=1474 RepID=A0A380BCX2_SPOPA|nr:SDR family oxidoreductase [Sporosarcina pasteurii]MDS9472369.1 SDR family oxidoreductase [Sporosarcina pasteurii]QBQ06347.1 SDR family oxidoreductase [Sporosarcina pasteurii]SUI98918.1 General stress protein 39 [Sporosarcina pasteurii]